MFVEPDSHCAARRNLKKHCAGHFEIQKLTVHVIRYFRRRELTFGSIDNLVIRKKNDFCDIRKLGFGRKRSKIQPHFDRGALACLS